MKNKTLPQKSWERNEITFAQSRGVVAVPVVVEPVVVRAPLAIVEVEVTDVEIAIRVAVCV